MKTWTATLFSLCLIFLTEKASAQIVLDDEAVGLQYSILPVLGYNSDLGLIGGGYLQRIDYGEGVRPFVSSTSVELTLSTQGHFATELDHEQLESFGTDLRSRLIFQGYRILRSNYFGMGNESTFSESEFDDGRYFFEERHVGMQYWGRKNLTQFGEHGVVDGHLLAVLSYSNPISRGMDTMLEIDQPVGIEGGWMNQFGVGMIVDTRKNEFDPDRGVRLEANIMQAHAWLGSGYRFTHLFGEFRHYVSLLPDLVIAQKLEGQFTTGDVPFWKLPTLGHDLGLRGYTSNRFRGASSVLHIIEARSWIFGLYDNQIRFGGQVFMDTGRVFTGENRFRDLLSDLKQTYGFGGVMSILNPDFIFRGDIAFSEDLFRIYFGLGYLF